MRPHRNLKIASSIQKEISKIIVKDFEFKALVTVLDVAVDEDLLKTKIKLGIIPYKEGPFVWKELTENKKLIQRQLLKKIKIRFIPTLEFLIEETE